MRGLGESFLLGDTCPCHPHPGYFPGVGPNKPLPPFSEPFKSQTYILFFLNLFIFGCVGSLLPAACRLSLVVVSGGYSSLRCAGFSLRWLLLLRSTGLWSAGSTVVAHGLCCSAACGIFLDQGSNPCPLQWQADS